MTTEHKPQGVSKKLDSGWLTVERARERWNEIEAMQGDDEAAHSAEDALRRDALETIAELTAIALDTSRIDFARWCA